MLKVLDERIVMPVPEVKKEYVPLLVSGMTAALSLQKVRVCFLVHISIQNNFSCKVIICNVPEDVKLTTSDLIVILAYTIKLPGRYFCVDSYKLKCTYMTKKDFIILILLLIWYHLNTY